MESNMGSNQSNPSENPQPNQGEASQPVAEQPQNEAQENIEESEGEEVDESEHDSYLEEEEEDKASSSEAPGCPHYKCKLQMLCFKCDMYFACRFCHDEYWDRNIKEAKKHHSIDRFNIPKVRCILCENVQDPADECTNCHVKFADYCCTLCNLYDDMGIKKKVFHCDGCKICRVGGRENFFHCNICNMCNPISSQSEHECADFSQNCSICLEGFYSVKDTSVVLNCKHIVHSKCRSKYMQNSYVCPMCKKSMFSAPIMDHINTSIQQQINLVQMGELGERDVQILCNECGVKGNAKFHIVAMKCSSCNSFNTTMIKKEDLS